MCEIHSHGKFLRVHAPPFLTTPPGTNPAAPLDAPPSEPQDVTLTWNPQDPRVMQPGTKDMTVQVQNGRMRTDKVQSRDPLEPVDGKYVYPAGDARAAKTSAFATVAGTVSEFAKRFGDFKWSFNEQHLGVHGDGGKFLNAFYRRENQAVVFYHHPDPVLKTMVFSGGSGDVGSHESGHAILDGVRPQYFDCVTPEPRAFHESFGDCLAIHMALLNDKVLDMVMQQTGGDLSKPNAAAQIAEELGQAVNHTGGNTGGEYLRNANHDLKWSDPSKLESEKGGPNEVGWGRHSFGRVWTGAHFEVLKGVVAEKRKEGLDPRAAIVAANEEVFQRLADMLKEAPQGDFTYKDMAHALLRSEDKNHGNKYGQLIRDVFTRRQILPENDPRPVFMSLEHEDPRPLQVRLDASFGMFSGARVDVPYDPNSGRSEEDVARSTAASIHQLVKENKVRYNDPGYQMKFPKDQLNPQGEPYLAAVYWEDGEMVIKSLPWTVCC